MSRSTAWYSPPPCWGQAAPGPWLIGSCPPSTSTTRRPSFPSPGASGSLATMLRTRGSLLMCGGKTDRILFDDHWAVDIIRKYTKYLMSVLKKTSPDYWVDCYSVASFQGTVPVYGIYSIPAERVASTIFYISDNVISSSWPLGAKICIIIIFTGIIWCLSPIIKCPLSWYRTPSSIVVSTSLTVFSSFSLFVDTVFK